MGKGTASWEGVGDLVPGMPGTPLFSLREVSHLSEVIKKKKKRKKKGLNLDASGTRFDLNPDSATSKLAELEQVISVFRAPVSSSVSGRMLPNLYRCYQQALK